MKTGKWRWRNARLFGPKKKELVCKEGVRRGGNREEGGERKCFGYKGNKKVKITGFYSYFLALGGEVIFSIGASAFLLA